MSKSVPAYVSLDPVASTKELAIVVASGRHDRDMRAQSAIAILSRREVQRLAHQLQRWLEWDRVRQGTPRQYLMKCNDLYPAVMTPPADMFVGRPMASSEAGASD